VAATVHPIATDAAVAMLELGGSAVDAAIAAGLCLGVVDGHNSGLGGGCFFLIYHEPQGAVAIDGREEAPGAATRDMFLEGGKANGRKSQTGPLASGIPGQLAAMEEAHRRFGKLPWKTLFDPAIQVAHQGFCVGPATAQAIQSEAADLAQDPTSARLLLPGGKPLTVGQRLLQPELAQTLRHLAEEGSSYFYRGPFAAACCKALGDSGGIMTMADMDRYRAIERRAIGWRYRDQTLYGFPPPSSGGLHIAQMLQMLERFPLAQMHTEDPVRFYHVVVEAMKLAFADRAHWLGDPDFVRVPAGLVDPKYCRSLSEEISLDRATEVAGHATPDDLTESFENRKHTTHLTTVDSQGMWVAMTATINTTWGSKVMIPGTGVMMNNEMDDFSIQPGIPNAFGLVGAEANSVAAGKRPLSSMSPTIVCDPSGKAIYTCGAAGGPKIISATLLNLLRGIDLGMSIDAALAAPRIHHQWRPDRTEIEAHMPRSISEGLASMGHTTRIVRHLATAQGAQAVPMGVRAASDPRSFGRAQSSRS
jgi:gamma-glutamyltranspeptidase/glutathione hydrolase